jgi:N-acetylglutamate synthase-like GNAT family acetyltransferase
MKLRPARPDEAATLSDLAMRSKAHWGYDDEFLARCRPVLTLKPDEIVSGRTTVASEDGRVVGFYTLNDDPPEGELGNLWIDPAHMRKGAGRLLLTHAVETARAVGFKTLLIAADPNAEGFYRAMGAVRTGSVASEVTPGRELPLLRLDLQGDR